jgi:hypothetical protein
MNENERRDRINHRLAEVGLSIESSGLRGTTAAWETALGLTACVTTVEEAAFPEGMVGITTTEDALRQLTHEFAKRILATKSGKGAVDVNKWDEADKWFRDTLKNGGMHGQD